MSLGMVVEAFDGLNQSGIRRMYSVSKEARYRKVPATLLIDHDLYFGVRSTRMGRSSTSDANLILFYSSGGAYTYFPNYTGAFVQLRHFKTSDNFLLETNTGGFLSQSLLLVRTNLGTEHRVSVKNSFLAQAIELIDASLPSVAQRNGDPVLTWEMWPSGISYLNSNRKYLKMHQRLRIKPVSKTYDATITYHIYLYLDASGKPRASGSRWAYWIESGVLTNKIEQELKPAVVDGLGTTVDFINASFGAFTGNATFTDLYLLPGDNTNVNAPQVWGNTDDDVTIVLER